MERLHICLNSQMFKQMCSLSTLNSIYSLIKLCSIDVVDIPLKSHDLDQHFYFYSLFLTQSAEKHLFCNPPAQMPHVNSITIWEVSLTSCVASFNVCYGGHATRSELLVTRRGRTLTGNRIFSIR